MKQNEFVTFHAAEKALLEKYNALVAIQNWNRSFRVPPVCTAKWDEDDFATWEASRQPLPVFAKWLESATVIAKIEKPDGSEKVIGEMSFPRFRSYAESAEKHNTIPGCIFCEVPA